jgi:hypothetical protein
MAWLKKLGSIPPMKVHSKRKKYVTDNVNMAGDGYCRYGNSSGRGKGGSVICFENLSFGKLSLLHITDPLVCALSNKPNSIIIS